MGGKYKEKLSTHLSESWIVKQGHSPSHFTEIVFPDIQITTYNVKIHKEPWATESSSTLQVTLNKGSAYHRCTDEDFKWSTVCTWFIHRYVTPIWVFTEQSEGKFCWNRNWPFILDEQMCPSGSHVDTPLDTEVPWDFLLFTAVQT